MLLILLGMVQLLFENYIELKILGKGLNMSQFLIFLSLFLGNIVRS